MIDNEIYKDFGSKSISAQEFLTIESFEKPQIQNSLRRTQRTSSLIRSTPKELKSLMRFP